MLDITCRALLVQCGLVRFVCCCFCRVKNHRTPSPPTNSFPTKSPRVELSGRLPIKPYGHENARP